MRKEIREQLQRRMREINGPSQTVDTALPEKKELIFEAPETKSEGLLTDREVQVLQYLADGHNMREIALVVGGSEQYLKRRMQFVRKKLDAPNSLNAVAICIRRGIID